MGYKKLILINLKVFVLIILAVVNSQSQTPNSAKIISIEGTTKITRVSNTGNSQRIKPSTGDYLKIGDVIQTNSGGRLVIKLPDGSQAIISENTTVEIMDLTNSPRTIFKVLRGKTRIKIEKLGGKPNPYRITTPTTVIAVRGTIFDVFVKGEETRVFVIEGEVSVANLLLPDQEVILTEGQFTRVKKESPPSPPSVFKPERNNDLFKPIAEQNRNRNPFGDPSADNPGKSGTTPGKSGNAPGNSGNAPGNSGNKRKRGGN